MIPLVEIMNIDKFGHHVHKRLRFNNFLDSDTLQLTSDNRELKIFSLRLQNLPTDSDHAVNKRYVDSLVKDLNMNKSTDTISNLIKIENGVVDFKSAKLKGLRMPTSANEAVNKEYIDNLLTKYCTQEQVIREISRLRNDIIKLIEGNLRQ